MRHDIEVDVDGILVTAKWWIEGRMLSWAIESPSEFVYSPAMRQHVGHPDDDPELEVRAEIADFVRSQRTD